MLNRRRRPGSSSTSRIRPRSGAVPGGLLCIWTIFTFPNRSFDAGDGIESLAHVVELELELTILLERCLQLRSCAVVAFGSRRRRGSLQPRCFGVEDQPLLDVFQMNQGEGALLG